MIDFIVVAIAFCIGWFFGYRYSLKISDLLSKELVVFGKEIDVYSFFVNFKYVIAGFMILFIFFYEKKEDLYFIIMFSVGISILAFMIAVQVGFFFKTISKGLEKDG